MGVKNSKNYNEMESVANLAFNGQFMNNGHMAPNDFFAFQQNQRYPISMLPQRHHSMNMGAVNNITTNHNTPKMPIQQSLGDCFNKRLVPGLNDNSLNMTSHLIDTKSNSISTTSSRNNHEDKIDKTSKSPNRSILDSHKKKLIPTKSSLLQELLECPICMNLYDNPYVLPCQHTFCKRCLISLKNENPNNNCIDCPICRVKHTLGTDGIEGLTANYTMKRLIELDAMCVEKEKTNNKEKAKCFVCQKFCYLEVCNDCSYMLCYDCLDDPNHDIIIESKIIARKKKLNQAFFQDDFIQIPKHNMLPTDYNFLHDHRHPYSEMKYENDSRLKLVLLCHSSAVEDQDLGSYRDEQGPYVKIVISYNDRISTLKKLVENKFGISCKDQILVYKDRILKNDLQQLIHYHIKQFSRIHIFDSRDIKANADEIDCDLYGIYQEAESEQTLDIHTKKEKHLHKNSTPQHQLNRRISFQNGDTNLRTTFQQSVDHKLIERSSSSQSYSSVIGSSSNEEIKDSNDILLKIANTKRNQNYRTLSATVKQKTILEQQKLSSDNYQLHQTNESKQITGHVKNLRRGSMASSNKYFTQYSSFRLRKLDELFKKNNN